MATDQSRRGNIRWRSYARELALPYLESLTKHGLATARCSDDMTNYLRAHPEIQVEGLDFSLSARNLRDRMTGLFQRIFETGKEDAALVSHVLSVNGLDMETVAYSEIHTLPLRVPPAEVVRLKEFYDPNSLTLVPFNMPIWSCMKVYDFTRSQKATKSQRAGANAAADDAAMSAASAAAVAAAQLQASTAAAAAAGVGAPPLMMPAGITNLQSDVIAVAAEAAAAAAAAAAASLPEPAHAHKRRAMAKQASDAQGPDVELPVPQVGAGASSLDPTGRLVGAANSAAAGVLAAGADMHAVGGVGGGTGAAGTSQQQQQQQQLLANLGAAAAGAGLALTPAQQQQLLAQQRDASLQSAQQMKELIDTATALLSQLPLTARSRQAVVLEFAVNPALAKAFAASFDAIQAVIAQPGSGTPGTRVWGIFFARFGVGTIFSPRIDPLAGDRIN
jgi:hypothetical protein